MWSNTRPHRPYTAGVRPADSGESQGRRRGPHPCAGCPGSTMTCRCSPAGSSQVTFAGAPGAGGCGRRSAVDLGAFSGAGRFGEPGMGKGDAGPRARSGPGRSAGPGPGQIAVAIAAFWLAPRGPVSRGARWQTWRRSTVVGGLSWSVNRDALGSGGYGPFSVVGSQPRAKVLRRSG
jgi:hypothetical protein